MFTKVCLVLFRYQFSGDASAGVDYIPLSVEFDAGHGRFIRERVYLEVVVRGGETNFAPVLRINSTKVPVVRQSAILRLNTEMLSVMDRESDLKYIAINITSQLDSERDGYFARTNDYTRPLRSFRYDELVSRRIAFKPPSHPVSGEVEVSAELVAVDSRFATSEPATLTINVRSASSVALRVLHNRGLVVPESGSQPVTLNDLDFVEAAGRRPDNVRIHVKAGLRRGRIEVDGQSENVFTLNDIERNKVAYHHSENDATDDRVVFRVTSGRHSIRVRFPIFVLASKNRTPTLASAGDPLVVPRGGYAQILPVNLKAEDHEIADHRQIIFDLVDQPSAGEITKRINSLTTGHRVSVFSQFDVDRGFIYYRHRGGETDKDRVDYRITYLTNLPNHSGTLFLEVLVTPSSNFPPHEMEGTERQIVVEEASGAVLGKDRLWYEDVENRSYNVIYTITSQPSFPSDLTTTDAGRLVFLNGRDDPADSYTRLSTAPALFTFTQADVNEGRVAYVAPRTDIGPKQRLCHFLFAVEDRQGTAIIDQMFNVTVTPVDNQRPRLRPLAAAVSTAGSRSVRLGADNLVIYDPDTDFSKLVVSVLATPKFGELKQNGQQLKIGDTFPAADFNTSDIRSRLFIIRF